MQSIIKIFSLRFCLIIYNNIHAQLCSVTVDIANLKHVNYPNGFLGAYTWSIIIIDELGVVRKKEGGVMLIK